MAELRRTANNRIEDYRQLIAKLPDVFAAGLRCDEQGELTEVHVLASSCRNPKQIARDVQSALFAAYGLDVDHRIISIAQLPDNPVSAESEQPCESVRLLLAGWNTRHNGGEYVVEVQLSHDDQVFKGAASCRDQARSLHARAAALATLDAVHQFLGTEVYSLMNVGHATLCGEPISLVGLECVDGQSECLLVGAAMTGSDPVQGVIHSTLDALNRSIGRVSRKF